MLAVMVRVRVKVTADPHVVARVAERGELAYQEDSSVSEQ
jgi:hypothetical protein